MGKDKGENAEVFLLDYLSPGKTITGFTPGENVNKNIL